MLQPNRLYVVLRREHVIGVQPYSVHGIREHAEGIVADMTRAGIECEIVEVAPIAAQEPRRAKGRFAKKKSTPGARAGIADLRDTRANQSALGGFRGRKSK